MASRRPPRKVPSAIAQPGREEAAWSFLRRSIVGDEEYLPELRLSVDIVQKAARRPLDARQLDDIDFQIKGLVIAYRFGQSVAEARSKVTLHEIADPISEVIAKLEQRENELSVLVALGAPLFSPDDESLPSATAQYEIMLRGLRNIRDKVLTDCRWALFPVRSLPTKRRGRGRPRAHDLHLLVERLADIWETFSGRKFSQLWEKGDPISPAARFVHAIIKVADPKRLRSVPDVTEQAVKRRRKATSVK